LNTLYPPHTDPTFVHKLTRKIMPLRASSGFNRIDVIVYNHEQL